VCVPKISQIITKIINSGKINYINRELPLPTFPNQFSAEIEANIVNFNLTLHVTEYYDNINQRGRIESYSAFGSNVTIFNYDTMEVSHIVTGPGGQRSSMAVPLAALNNTPLDLLVCCLVHNLSMVQPTLYLPHNF